jgi:hypothetical protein
MSQTKAIIISCVTNNGAGITVFAERKVDLYGSNERMLSDQMSALNFRLRESDASYSSAWHVAGDATLLVVLAGTLRIELRSGETRDFSSGEMFVAEDYLSVGVKFDPIQHGHRAAVVGDERLSVMHVKLEKR